MTKPIFTFAALIGSVAVILASCGDGDAAGGVDPTGGIPGMTPVATAVPASVRVANRGVPFAMAIDEVVGLSSEAITVRFAEVIEDSRCPEDETCVWEGAVAVAIDWADDGTTGTVVLRGIAFPEGPYFGVAPLATLPGGATIELLALDAVDGVSSVTVVWDAATN